MSPERENKTPNKSSKQEDARQVLMEKTRPVFDHQIDPKGWFHLFSPD